MIDEKIVKAMGLNPEGIDWFVETYGVGWVDVTWLLRHCVINAVANQASITDACKLIVEHTNGEQSPHTLQGHLICIQHFTRRGMSARFAAETVITVLNSVNA